MSEEFYFYGRAHNVAFINDNTKTLTVEVRDAQNDEEWRGAFSSNCDLLLMFL